MDDCRARVAEFRRNNYTRVTNELRMTDSPLLAYAVVGALEIVALYLIFRLWRRRSLGLISRVVWTLILLVPLIGLLIYGLIMCDPNDEVAGSSSHDAEDNPSHSFHNSPHSGEAEYHSGSDH